MAESVAAGGYYGVPAGLILLVGAPGAGKSSFARAWVERGRIGADGVVSCDTIRAQLFGAGVHVADDPAVFNEMDKRVATRLSAGLPVVVDATNVLPHARARMIAWARQHGRPVTALQFKVETPVLVRRNATRIGHARVPTEDVLEYAEIAAAHASPGQLLGEGVDLVVSVPGEADGASPSDAAAAIHLWDSARPPRRS